MSGHSLARLVQNILCLYFQRGIHTIVQFVSPGISHTHLVGSYNLQKIHTFAGLFAHFLVSNITREF